MKNDAIIFDIDGTLWDATSATADGWNAGLEKLGISKMVTAGQIKGVIGRTQTEALSGIFPDLVKTSRSLPEVLDFCEAEAIRESGGVFYGGVIGGMEKLSGLFKIFLVSNCTDWYMASFLRHAQIGPFLSGFDCHGMSGLPKGQMLARIKEKYSLKEPVYIGDTASDEEAAALAGMEFIHVSYGFGAPKNNHKSFSSFPTLVDYFINHGKINL